MLIQAVFKANQDNERFILFAPYPAAALPGRHHRSRIANQNADIQISYINTQLKCTGCYNSQQRAIGKPGFNLSSFFRQITGPVGCKLGGQLTQALLGPDRNQFGKLS